MREGERKRIDGVGECLSVMRERERIQHAIVIRRSQ